MKILFVDREISMAGSCVVTMNCAREMVKLGMEVGFAGMFKTRGYPDPTGVRLITPNTNRVKIIRSNTFLLTFLGPIFLFFETLRAARDYDVIIGCSYPTHWIAYFAAKLRGKKMVWHCFEPWIFVRFDEIKKAGFWAWLASLIARSPIDRLIVRNIEKIYTMDNKNRIRVKNIYGKDAKTIYAGVDYNFFSGGSSSKSLKRWKLDKNKFYIVCSGSLTPMKNHEILIKALCKIKDRAEKMVLLVAGSGPLENELKMMAESCGLGNKVKFLGQVEPFVLRDLYRLARFVVFPAVRQTWGLTPFEAACCATPSIVSSDCGASELVAEKSIGIVSPPDSVSFAKNMLYLYKNPAKLRTLSLKAEKFVKNEHSWRQYAENVIGYIKYENTNSNTMD